jgi:hypothetical protein
MGFLGKRSNAVVHKMTLHALFVSKGEIKALATKIYFIENNADVETRNPTLTNSFFLKRLPGVGSKPGFSRFHLFSHFSPLYR